MAVAQKKATNGCDSFRINHKLCTDQCAAGLEARLNRLQNPTSPRQESEV